MSKVFTAEQFISKLKWLVNDVPNVYASGSGIWCTLKNGKWRMDCVCSIKGLLWGFSADKSKLHGGAIYGSNGVKDFTCNGALNYCTDVSQDFSKIIAGEYLCMKGTKFNHSGIYLGNGKVFECTTGWNTNKCIISDISSTGVRSYKGKKLLKWTYHGKLDYIDYGMHPQDVNVYYRVKVEKYGWQPETKNLEQYLGVKDHNIIDIAIKVDKGKIKYRVSPKNKAFLPYVTGYNINDYNNGFAGNNTPIDRVQAYYYTPDDIAKTSGYKKAKYRVDNLPWQYDDEKDKLQDGFAGIKGKPITRFQIEIK